MISKLIWLTNFKRLKVYLNFKIEPLRKLILYSTCFILIFTLASLTTVHNAPKSYKQKLSEYGFFQGQLSNLEPGEGLVPYELNSPLFSDYALKSRFIKLPEGQQVVYNGERVFDFPKGTAIIKTFYYQKDANKPQKGRQLMETRLLLHEEEGWVALPYVWDDKQSDAFLEIAGATKTVQWKDASGKKQKINYSVPNMVQCKACHSYKKTLVPIGPSARQLNRMYAYASGEENQLAYWQKKNMISGLPAHADIPELSKYNDKSLTISKRARAYLDANCGHCHNPDGPANTSGMFLDIHTNAPEQLGVHKAPIAAGRGTGNRLYGIEPGEPDASILLYRMESKDPGVMMPEVGRQMLHEEGIRLVRQWIKEME